MMSDRSNQETWTPERVELLQTYVKAGLTCSQIAGEIGVSRNAVIGKIHRLGLAPGRPAAAPARERPPRVRRPRLFPPRLRVVSSQMTAAETAPEIDSARSCSLLELAQGRCRWPINDPRNADFAFCGNDALAGFSYCLGHARMAYRRRA